MKKLADRNPEKVIDILNERLAFERSAIKLYDRILDRMAYSDSDPIIDMIDPMQIYRDQEREHVTWLEDQIESLGGDPKLETDLSRLVETETQGIEQAVLEGDADVSHLFHALLAEELVDHAGWELLLELADEADDELAREAFRTRLHEEEDQLIFIRDAVADFARDQVLHPPAEVPASP